MIPTELPLSADLGLTPARDLATSPPTRVAERFADLLLLRPPRDSLEAAVGLVAQGISAREIYLDVLAPALRVIGTRWQRGIATIAQEHLATAVVGTIMTHLAGRVATSPAVGLRIVLACTDGELHETGLRMVRDFLVGDGWEMFYLGADTPSDGLLRLVDRVQPDVVGLSTALPDRSPWRTPRSRHCARGRPDRSSSLEAVRMRPTPSEPAAWVRTPTQRMLVRRLACCAASSAKSRILAGGDLPAKTGDTRCLADPATH